MSSAEDLSRVFPTYLTDATRKSLEAELKCFLSSNSYFQDPFTSYKNDFFLQGDVLRKVPFPNWDKGSFATFNDSNCIILSNTCDIDPNNTRMTPLDCVLAPVLSVEKYQNILRKLGYSEDRIKNFRHNLINYKISNLFYLPIDESFSYSKSSQGYFASLDKAFSLPRSVLDLKQHTRSLNQFSSYLFTFQISVNFCRFHDKVDRDANLCFQ